VKPLRSPLSILIFTQVLLCLLETYLVSKISFIGKVGIAIVHREYSLLRSGWKTFLLLFSIQVVIIITLTIIEKKYPKKIAIIVSSAILLLGLIGLYVTFQDFLHTYTHRLLKERFHAAFYLFWLSWVSTCLYFIMLLNKRKPETFPLDPNTPI
jgi:hypothetical protein